MKLQNFCRLKSKKILRTDYFRGTQNFNHYIGIFVQSLELDMSSENNFFIKILIAITFKYVVVSVVAKTCLNFRGNTRKYRKLGQNL